jgi:hypothetical protein
VLGVLDVGETVTAIGRNDDASWLLLDRPSGRGWAAAGVLDVSGDPEDLPLIVPSPTPTSTPTGTATGTATAPTSAVSARRIRT